MTKSRGVQDRDRPGRIYDFLQTYPGSTFEHVRFELGITDAERASAWRLMQRMRARGYLLVSIGEDSDAGCYTVNPGVPFVDVKERVKRKRKRKRKTGTPEQQAARREYLRARRERAKAEGRCQYCWAGLPEEWSCALCPECHERHREQSLRYRQSEKGKQTIRAVKRRFYAKDPERERQRQRDDYQRRKIEGICQSCPLPCLSDSFYCLKHRDEVRERQRVRSKERRDVARSNRRAA